MSIVSIYIDVGLNSVVQRYYEQLGYELPRKKSSKGTLVVDYSKTIRICVGDLQLKSAQKIIVKCDYCGCIHEMVYRSYINNIHSHGGYYYCLKCSRTLFNSGENNPLYDSSKSYEERVMKRRLYPGYHDFIKKVLARDNYTCQCCGCNGSQAKLLVHHLDGYNWCVEGRIDETNAVTLCENCHNNFHNIYGRGNNTKQQYLEWMNVAQLELGKYDKPLSKTKRIFAYEENKVYNSAIEFARFHNIKNKIDVYNVCNHNGRRTVAKIHVFWLDEYINMSEYEIMSYVNNQAKITKSKSKNSK